MFALPLWLIKVLLYFLASMDFSFLALGRGGTFLWTTLFKVNRQLENSVWEFGFLKNKYSGWMITSGSPKPVSLNFEKFLGFILNALSLFESCITAVSNLLEIDNYQKRTNFFRNTSLIEMKTLLNRDLLDFWILLVLLWTLGRVQRIAS